MIASLAIDGAIASLVSLGILFVFVWGKMADLTPDASFTWGAVGAWIVTSNFALSPVAGLLFAPLLGGLAGLATYLIGRLGLPYLMASMVVVGSSYSFIWATTHGPLVTFEQSDSFFHQGSSASDAMIASMLVLALAVLIVKFADTRPGLVFRAAAENPNSVPHGVKNSNNSALLSLVIGNALIGLAGGLFANFSYFVEINMGTGTLIAGLGSFILGWAIFNFRRSPLCMVTAAILGALLLRTIMSLSLLYDVPGEWFRAITSACILVSLLVARAGARDIFKDLRL